MTDEILEAVKPPERLSELLDGYREDVSLCEVIAGKVRMTEATKKELAYQVGQRFLEAWRNAERGSEPRHYIIIRVTIDKET